MTWGRILGSWCLKKYIMMWWSTRVLITCSRKDVGRYTIELQSMLECFCILGITYSSDRRSTWCKSTFGQIIEFVEEKKLFLFDRLSMVCKLQFFWTRKFPLILLKYQWNYFFPRWKKDRHEALVNIELYLQDEYVVKIQSLHIERLTVMHKHQLNLSNKRPTTILKWMNSDDFLPIISGNCN
jgi:hypothetical protein